MAAMTETEVDEYRLRREITVEGKDVPKPVKTFKDASFPGNLHQFSSICAYLIYLGLPLVFLGCVW